MKGEALIIFPTLQTYRFELAYEYKQCCQLLSLNSLMVYWGKNTETKWEILNAHTFLLVSTMA